MGFSFISMPIKGLSLVVIKDHALHEGDTYESNRLEPPSEADGRV